MKLPFSGNDDPMTFSEVFDGKIKITIKSGNGDTFFEGTAELPGDSKPEAINSVYNGLIALQKDKLNWAKQEKKQ